MAREVMLDLALMCHARFDSVARRARGFVDAAGAFGVHMGFGQVIRVQAHLDVFGEFRTAAFAGEHAGFAAVGYQDPGVYALHDGSSIRCERR